MSHGCELANDARVPRSCGRIEKPATVRFYSLEATDTGLILTLRVIKARINPSADHDKAE
jgi:hypothetical protein